MTVFWRQTGALGFRFAHLLYTNIMCSGCVRFEYDALNLFKLIHVPRWIPGTLHIPHSYQIWETRTFKI